MEKEFEKAGIEELWDIDLCLDEEVPHDIQRTEVEMIKLRKMEQGEPRGNSVVLVAMGNCGRGGYCYCRTGVMR